MLRGLRMTPEFIAASLQPGNLFYGLIQIFEKAVDSQLHGDELLHVEFSIFVFRLLQFALQKNYPCFDIFAFRFPSCDCEQ